MLICFAFCVANFIKPRLKCPKNIGKVLLFSAFFLSLISQSSFWQMKKKQSRQTVVIVSRKQVPNNRVIISDFLGCEYREKRNIVWIGGREERRGERRAREPKGLVAKVTVPTASWRKAKCAASQLAHFSPCSKYTVWLAKSARFLSIRNISRNLDNFDFLTTIRFHVSSTRSTLYDFIRQIIWHSRFKFKACEKKTLRGLLLSQVSSERKLNTSLESFIFFAWSPGQIIVTNRSRQPNPALFLLGLINVSYTGTLRTGHPVHSRTTYIRNGGARGRVRSRRNVCARARVYTRIYAERSGGCSPACLPACHGSRVRCPTGHWTQRDSTWGSSAGQATPLLRTANLPRDISSAGKEGARNTPSSPVPRREGRRYPPATQVNSSDRPALWTRTAASRANIFAGEQHARQRRRTDVRGALFARVANARPENLERALFGRRERERISRVFDK